MDNIVAFSRGYTKENFNYLEKGNMEVFIDHGDRDYCGVSPRSSERGSRFLVQNCEEFKRVEVKTANISIHSPGSNPHVMETRSFQQR